MGQKYRLTRGTHREADGTKAEPGDVVELTEHQQAALNMRRFEEVDDEPEVVEAESVPDTVTEDEFELPDDIPEDYGRLRQIASVYEGVEMNGRSGRTTIENTLSAMTKDEREALYDKADEQAEE